MAGIPDEFIDEAPKKVVTFRRAAPKLAATIRAGAEVDKSTKNVTWRRMTRISHRLNAGPLLVRLIGWSDLVSRGV